MNEPDDSLRAHFQRQHSHDESRAPSFHAMSAHARLRALLPHRAPRRSRGLWLVPATAAIALAVVFLRPRPAPSHEYSDRIATLIADLDTAIFVENALPSDLLPTAFP